MLFNTKFVLASSSLSRAFILKSNKLKFIKIPPGCDEEKIKHKIDNKKHLPKTISLILAKEKAKSISKTKKNILVIGADTVIEFKKKIITKAKNMTEARKKLLKLSGKKHKIISSAAAYYNSKLIWSYSDSATVKLRHLKTNDIKKYLIKCGPQILSSVGCYHLEKKGPIIIEDIKGDCFTVMGFPLFSFLKFLKEVK